MGACYLKKSRETLEKLKACAENDHCERTDCAYFVPPDELKDFLEWMEVLIQGEEDEEVPE